MVGTIIALVLAGLVLMARFADVDEAAAGAASASPIGIETPTRTSADAPTTTETR